MCLSPSSVSRLSATFRQHPLPKGMGANNRAVAEGPVPERGFLLHSYGGLTEMVAFAQLGAYFSFPGYWRAAKGRHREAFKSVPADRLLIETDAPDQRLPDALNAYPLTDSAGEPMNHPANLPVCIKVWQKSWRRRWSLWRSRSKTTSSVCSATNNLLVSTRVEPNHGNCIQ